MQTDNPRSTASIGGHPIHAMLAAFPMVCFVATFVTDVVYWRTAAMMWANMSAWLLSAGLLTSVFVVTAGLIDFVGDSRIRRIRAAWLHACGNALAVALSIVNLLVHSRDAYTSVAPTGLILSGVVVLILLITGWLGGSLVFRHGVGVRTEPRS